MKNRRFTLHLFPTLVAILMLLIFLALSYWQVQRAQQKRLLQTQFEQCAKAKPLLLSPAMADMPEKYRYCAVQVTGHFDNEHVLLLDNKIYQHQVGYEVLTPFVPNTGQRALLVNRGWIPLGQTREHLPQVPSVAGNQTLYGIIAVPAAKPFMLAQQLEHPNQWPVRIEQIEIERLQTLMSVPLYPIVLLLSPEASHGFVRAWSGVPSTAGNKHLGYAVQWFALAIVVVIIFIRLSYRRQ
jgi:surfeit locus 1 family protein